VPTAADATPTVAVEREPAADPQHSGELQARIGYEASLWGDGHVLHGPQLALRYGWPFAGGRLGASAGAFVAWPTRLEHARLDADVFVTALRALAVFDPSRAPGLGIETAAGLSGRLIRIEAVSDGDAAVGRAARTELTFGAHLYCAARWRSQRAAFALGLALELDLEQVQYGVQYRDGFVATHSPARVRPSLLANAGFAF
jgi:hypothetical protein